MLMKILNVYGKGRRLTIIILSQDERINHRYKFDD